MLHNTFKLVVAHLGYVKLAECVEFMVFFLLLVHWQQSETEGGGATEHDGEMMKGGDGHEIFQSPEIPIFRSNT